jgi:hypothetical protein
MFFKRIIPSSTKELAARVWGLLIWVPGSSKISLVTPSQSCRETSRRCSRFELTITSYISNVDRGLLTWSRVEQDPLQDPRWLFGGVSK